MCVFCFSELFCLGDVKFVCFCNSYVFVYVFLSGSVDGVRDVTAVGFSMLRCLLDRLLGIFFVLLIFLVGCGDSREVGVNADIESRVVVFCGACHNVPDPMSLPRDAWYQAVQNGYDFYYASGRADLEVPSLNAVVQWFRERAPEDVVISSLGLTRSSINFRRQPLGVLADRDAVDASVSHVAIDGEGESLRILVGDMKSGAVYRLDPHSSTDTARSLVSAGHPAGMAVCDLDADGYTDLIVADLGSFQPHDHSRGSVIWMRMLPDGTSVSHVILNNVGRVADVQPGDFDGDGDLDLIVAEFGWRKTGRVLILWQHSGVGGAPEFKMEVVDERHGAIHVPVVDLDGNGHLDFIVLFSQEFEEVDAFLNLGGGRFERQVVFNAGDPGFGSSGIDLVDLDRDGDLDIIYTNGDTLDTKLLKKYHGVHWLENQGDFPFVYRELSKLPGASRAKAADVDADGDLDVVAVAWIPDVVALSSGNGMREYYSLVWLEQVDRGVFQSRGVVSQRQSGYLTLDVSDIDGDGDIDFAAGCFGRQDDGSIRLVDVFWNDGADAQFLRSDK